MEHILKIEDNYLDNLVSKRKKVEIRLNDRDYQKGDILVFNKYFAARKTERYEFEITHIHSGLGLKENFVALSVSYIAENK